jgi:dienelactone hydrolase
MRVKKVPLELRNPSGDLIRGDLRFLNTKKKKPLVIVCHSFMAFKDWGFFPYIGEQFAQAGYVSFVFNFSHNGVVNDHNRITEFDKFERNSISKELEDLDAVVHHFVNDDFEHDGIDKTKLVLLGHSRGGGGAIVHTASDERVTALVTWSSISTFDRWTPHQKDCWRTNGFHPLAKEMSSSPLRMGIQFLNDIEQHKERYSITIAASKIHLPWLLIHGQTDVTVPAREAEALYQPANKTTTELLLLPHIGHLYNASTFDEDKYQTLNHILDLTIHWLQTKL